MPIHPVKNHTPQIDQSVFIAPDCWILGQVTIEENVSCFFGAVLRGDINPIKVGKGSNIQEHAVLHTSKGLGPCVVEEDVTVGHRAILHGCHIKSRSIIGMGSTILDNAVIGEDCIVGAQALVPMNFNAPAKSLILGVPAKVIRQLTDQEIESIKDSAARYRIAGQYYKELLGGDKK